MNNDKLDNIETDSKENNKEDLKEKIENNNNEKLKEEIENNEYLEENIDDYIDFEEKEPKDKKKTNKKINVVGISAMAAIFGLTGGVIGSQLISPKSNNVQSYKINATTVSSENVKDLTNVSDIVQSSIPSIVSITAASEIYYQQGFYIESYELPSSGSGVIYSQTDDSLFIVTNYHVIEESSSLTIGWFDGTTSNASVQGYSESNDIALLKVDIKDIESSTLSKLKVAITGDSDKCIVGEGTIAIGNALGYGQTVTEGIVSALNREIKLSDSQTLTMMQTSAAINPGNSGGALLNAKGELIGINSAKYMDTSVEGIGYAIPINKVIDIVKDIIDGKIEDNETEGVLLGITGYDVTDETSKIYNMPLGVCVQSVNTSSPADKGGIKPGDIITKVNNIPITSISQLKSIITGLNKGDSIELNIKHPEGNTYKDVSLTINF